MSEDIIRDATSNTMAVVSATAPGAGAAGLVVRPLMPTDGTNVAPVGDAVNRPVFVEQTDGAAALGKAAVGLDAGLTASVPVEHAALVDNNNGTFTSANAEGEYRARVVSALNTANVLVVDLRNLHDLLAIHMAASAGTASLQVEVSSDGGTTWIALEAPIAAAATIVKMYFGPTTVGATVALSPLAFRHVRITASTAGVGNSTTLTVGAK